MQRTVHKELEVIPEINNYTKSLLPSSLKRQWKKGAMRFSGEREPVGAGKKGEGKGERGVREKKERGEE